MPIPRIPYRDYDNVLDRNVSVLDEKPIWIDIYERLYTDRTLFLCKEVTRPFANRFIALLLLLNSETDDYNDTDIYIYINSLGGDAHQSIAIYNTLKVMLPDVCTIAMGLAASGASLILAGGTITRRVAYPNARILIHQPRSALTSTNKNLIIQEKETLKLRNTIADIYAENTGKPVDVIQKDLERDSFMSATETQDYGIIDHIVKSKKENEIKE